MVDGVIGVGCVWVAVVVSAERMEWK